MKIMKFLKENKHFYALLLLVPLLILFKYLEFTLIPRYYTHMALDDDIPFLKIFVIPYVIWFPYIAFGLIYTGLHNTADYYRLLIFLGGGMSVAYIIYVLFPNGEALRPVITQNDPLSELVKFIYMTDTPTNVCPSVHVINAIAVEAALAHSKDFRSVKGGEAASALLTILICLSTVFIKQHSVEDVLYGLLVSAVFYTALYGLPEIRTRLSRRKACFPMEKRSESVEIRHFYQ